MRIEPLSKLDLGEIKALLTENNLPVEDISGKVEFFGIKNQQQLNGVVGLEIFPETALLRSLVVADGKKGTGLGKKLCSYALNYLQGKKVKKVFLLTTTAKPFFIDLGFTETERGKVPEEIINTTEFASVCPASADCLMMELS
ncbi:arsenic resistance N-acetyltransferase ArsN2 [Flexithrix dorotheae]|uniref:arsenic resistance N-acetyltransferase ArsN2 n=1 Tax=Flexithrix dorotheae TaxID=70993 RepID=UPI0003686F6C|nr:arsenic resistance N-acetyltransferase ArsN2 [Flexithrix dorotheae]